MRRFLLFVLLSALCLPARAAFAKTAPQADTDPPGIASRYPGVEQGNVSLDSTSAPFRIRVRFDERMDPASISTAAMRLRADGASSDVPLALASLSEIGGQTEAVWDTVPPADPLNPFASNRVIFGGIRYTATLDGSVRDLAGNPLGGSVSWSFQTHPDYVGDTNQNHFLAGALESCLALVSGPVLAPGVLASDLVLRGSYTEDFNGAALPAGWTKSGAGSAALADSVLRLQGARIDGAGHPLQAGQSLFVFALLGGQAGQGLGLQSADGAQYARLAVENGPGGLGLYAHTRAANGATADSGPLTSGATNFANGGFRFLIRVEPGSIAYEAYIDGGTRIVLAAHNLALSAPLAPYLVDSDPAGAQLSAPWLNVFPAQSGADCRFTSRVQRADRLAGWQKLFWMGSRAGMHWETRSGSSSTPDASWSGWAALQPGDIVASPAAVYIQYRLTVQPAGSDPRWLENIWIEYTGSGPVLMSLRQYLPMLRR